MPEIAKVLWDCVALSTFFLVFFGSHSNWRRIYLIFRQLPSSPCLAYYTSFEFSQKCYGPLRVTGRFPFQQVHGTRPFYFISFSPVSAVIQRTIEASPFTTQRRMF